MGSKILPRMKIKYLQVSDWKRSEQIYKEKSIKSRQEIYF